VYGPAEYLLSVEHPEGGAISAWSDLDLSTLPAGWATFPVRSSSPGPPKRPLVLS
jgi:hypothetical protein